MMLKRGYFILILSVFLLIFVSGCALTNKNIPESTEDKIPTSEQISSTLENKSQVVPEVKNASLEEPVEKVEEVPLTFEEAVWKKRIDAALSPSYCPPVEKKTYPNSYYQGPLIDAHFHLPSLPDSLPGEENGEAELYLQYYGKKFAEEEINEEGDEEDDDGLWLGKNIKLSEIACTLQHEGTFKNFALFPISPEIQSYALEMAEKSKEQYPELFIPFMQGPFQPGDSEELIDDTIHALDQYAAVFRGWGEISLYVLYDSRNAGQGEELPPDASQFMKIYPTIKKHKMMVWFHPGEDQRSNFERVLQKYPEINFIVHGDQIKDDIGPLMAKYSNIYFCINDLYGDQLSRGDLDIFDHENKADFFAVFKNYKPLIQRDLENWQELIEAHPDQVMWCLDRDVERSWTLDRDVGVQLVDYSRAFIGSLDPAVQEKFAYKNAERMLGE